jgi:hypothetical protein
MATDLILNKGVNLVSGEHVFDETDGRDQVIICLPIHKTPEMKSGKSRKGNFYKVEEATPGIWNYVLVLDGVAYTVAASVSRHVNEL